MRMERACATSFHLEVKFLKQRTYSEELMMIKDNVLKTSADRSDRCSGLGTLYAKGRHVALFVPSRSQAFHCAVGPGSTSPPIFHVAKIPCSHLIILDCPSNYLTSRFVSLRLT
jgi:hypothetical protein